MLLFSDGMGSTDSPSTHSEDHCPVSTDVLERTLDVLRDYILATYSEIGSLLPGELNSSSNSIDDKISNLRHYLDIFWSLSHQLQIFKDRNMAILLSRRLEALNENEMAQGYDEVD